MRHVEEKVQFLLCALAEATLQFFYKNYGGL